MHAALPLPEYPFSPASQRISGQRLSYLDEGQGPVLVMLHGNPSWSYLYRHLVLALRGQYRCIVPDHLGCGFSDKPQSASSYLLQAHIDNLDALLERLGIERCILVLHDWGGAIGMGWAARHPERVAGFVVLNTAAFRSARIPLRIAVCRWPLIGAFLVRGLNAFARAATFMAVQQKMPAERAAAFIAPYDTWRNRVALHRFVEDIPLHPSHPSWPTLVGIENSLPLFANTPMLLCWGGMDFCFDAHFYAEWRRRFPAAEAHFFPQAGHYVLEDALEAMLPQVQSFIAKVFAP